MQTRVTLEIRNFSKPIEYAPVERDTPRNSNHGFRNVKGRPDEALLIPELQYNETLKNAILAISNRPTPFFTMGCEQSLNEKESLHWMRGFIELAFNHRDLIVDAQSYFKLFFDFNFAVFDNNFDLPVTFSWQLEGAELGDLRGFSVAIWITTGDLKDASTAQQVWEASVQFLTQFLRSVPTWRRSAPIY